MPLFKYTSAKAADYLATCTLRFSPPGDFNDPFDGVAITAPILDSPAYKKAEADHLGFTAAQLAADSQLAAGVAIGRKILEEKVREGYRDELISDLNRNFRVLCLSKASPDSAGAALMWGHYAQDPDRANKPHAGLVLEFDDSNPWFADHRGRADRAMAPVIYRATRPSIATDQRDVIFVKSALWRYEEEVRLVRSIGQSTNDLADPGTSIAQFPPQMLKTVYVGLYATSALLEKVKAVVAGVAQLSHVRVLKITAIDADEYKLAVAT